MQTLLTCVSCNPELQAGIFTSDAPRIFAAIASQFVIVGALVGLLHRLR
jgi:hypothetical protein